MSRAAAVAAVRFTLYMAVNFCYSDTTSAIFFSITQAKRKRDPKSACEDIRYSAKANNKGCRHRETAASQKQRRGAVIPPPPHFMIARIRMNVNNTMPFYAQKNAKNTKTFKNPLAISHTYDIMYMQSGRAAGRSPERG